MVKTQLVIIQPTSFCNINCRYCYLPQRSLIKRITTETLTQICRVLFASPFIADKITIVWHAGEPLALPPEFYEQAFQCIEHWNTSGVRVTHSIQTNATLISQKWCDLFKKYEVQIGVSLDGPQHIHDAKRVDRAGRGTFDHVMRGVALLQENNLPFSAIAVVTNTSLDYPEEIWQFFMGIRPQCLGLNIEEAEGINEQSSLNALEDAERYKKFFKTIVDLSMRTANPISVREVETLMKSIQSGTPWMHEQTNVPGAIFSFDCDGNISTFSPELLTLTHPTQGRFTFGNVFANTLEDVFKHPKFIAINKQIQHGVYQCMQTCDYFMFCGGGCPSNKISENGTFDSTETQLCRLRIKMATDATLEYIEEQYGIMASPNSRESLK